MTSNMKIDKLITITAQLGIEKASQALTKLLRAETHIELHDVFFADISEITAKASASEEQVVGAVIDISGDAPLKFLFYVDERDTFPLADMMMRKPEGTCKSYDKYVMSTVQEIGNILSSAVAAAFSAHFDISLKTSPPAVIHDYSGVVFSEYIVSTGDYADKLLIVETVFRISGKESRCSMYVIPLRGSEKILHYLAISD